MFNKKIGWVVLSQCDGQIVRQEVEYGNRPAPTIIRLNSLRLFQKILKENSIWSSCHDSLRRAYEDCLKEFAVSHDNYGGYCLKFVGKFSIPSKTLIMNGPRGFLAEIEDGITDLSVVKKTSDLNKSFLMLGPIRFVNSDCDPNCEYDFSS